MKPHSMPVFLEPIKPRAYYPQHARALRRRAIFWRLFLVAVPLVIVVGGLIAVAEVWGG